LNAKLAELGRTATARAPARPQRRRREEIARRIRCANKGLNSGRRPASTTVRPQRRQARGNRVADAMRKQRTRDGVVQRLQLARCLVAAGAGLCGGRVWRGFVFLLSAPHPGCEFLGPIGPAGGRLCLIGALAAAAPPDQRDFATQHQVSVRNNDGLDGSGREADRKPDRAPAAPQARGNRAPDGVRKQGTAIE